MPSSSASDTYTPSCSATRKAFETARRARRGTLHAGARDGAAHPRGRDRSTSGDVSFRGGRVQAARHLRVPARHHEGRRGRRRPRDRPRDLRTPDGGADGSLARGRRDRQEEGRAGSGRRRADRRSSATTARGGCRNGRRARPRRRTDRRGTDRRRGGRRSSTARRSIRRAADRSATEGSSSRPTRRPRSSTRRRSGRRCCTASA